MQTISSARNYKVSDSKNQAILQVAKLASRK
jgi:hypothetical protein